MSGTASALSGLAAELRAEQSVISSHVVDPREQPALGMLAAAGTATAADPAAYATIVESVREGYLLHYGLPRLLDPPDRDLALLAGDYLYAKGLERLAGLRDLAAVRELYAHFGAEVSSTGGGAASSRPRMSLRYTDAPSHPVVSPSRTIVWPGAAKPTWVALSISASRPRPPITGVGRIASPSVSL